MSYKFYRTPPRKEVILWTHFVGGIRWTQRFRQYLCPEAVIRTFTHLDREKTTSPSPLGSPSGTCWETWGSTTTRSIRWIREPTTSPTARGQVSCLVYSPQGE